MSQHMQKSVTEWQGQPLIRLSDDRNQILIAPGHGARLIQWIHDERIVVPWPADADWAHATKVRGGDPILFPFVARHFVDGLNERWRDAAGTVRPMPQHGFARDARFSIEDDLAVHAVRMRLTDSEETRPFYPFLFQFDVVISLLERSRLELRFETTNLGDQSMPYYAGHHFYFAVPHAERSEWFLTCPCASWARQNSGGGIDHQEAKAETVSLADAALSDRFQVQPLTRNVILQHAPSQRRLVLELQPEGVLAPWYAVTTWTQSAESDFYCIEPWLGLPNAIHHGEGLRQIAPGAMETATCVLDAIDW